MDIKTLQYWHKLEHFYPYVIGEQTNQNIKTFSIASQDQFNALLNAPLPSGYVVRYYAVYLGIFQVDSALEALEQGIGRTMRFRDSGDDTSCLCTFTMSANQEFNPESFRISTFPWAVHRVRNGEIVLDRWDDDFHIFETGAFLRLKDYGEPLDYDFLLSLRDWYANQLNWSIAYCDIWLRIDRVIGEAFAEKRFEDVQESEDDLDGFVEPMLSEESQTEDRETDDQVKQNNLLNSFYIRDLERIIDIVKNDETSAGDCFRRYLEYHSENRNDIEKESDVRLSLLSPSLLPKGKWPGDYGLRLMQQVDVNAFLCRNRDDQQSLFSVNGPPGTGKTTLLKDSIAAIVVDRAIQMSALDMPDNAFTEMVCQIKVSSAKGTYTNDVWDIQPELKQYGILITSNNNGAVENITHTLPSLQEISPVYIDDGNHYFSEVSDLLFGEGKTWALNAAALGNWENRKQFINAFWPINPDHTKYNFRKELLEKTKKISSSKWEEARKSFQNALDAVHLEYRQAEDAYGYLQKLLTRRKELATLQANIRIIEDRVALLDTSLSELANAVGMIERQIKHICDKLEDMKKTQSFLWLKKLFSPNTPLIQTYRSLQRELQEQLTLLHRTKDSRHVTEQEIIETQAAMQKQRERLLELSSEIVHAEGYLAAFQKQTDSPLRMDAYFEDAVSEEANKSSPWGYETLNCARAKLFMEAIALHKAFVLNSRHLYDNLDAFSKMIRGMIPVGQLPIAAPVLLQSLMLAVPVVSTTFASVGIFLRHIPQQEIAYLFIDEAGQAMPQAAAGAIWRARNVIAVGDPLQIEPVVTLHDSVISALADHYGQDEIITSKYTSVQSLADMANRFGGYRTLTEENDLWIGAPLVVHNRCQWRVFTISNKIAYNEKMVYATKNREGAICRWLHVSGNSQNGHYVPNQAEAISKLVEEAFAAFASTKDESQKYPAIFVVSPFLSVKYGMVAFFRKNLASILKQNGINTPQGVINKWTRDCIGTIHTFQGKETDTVVLCLGVGSNGKNMGAVEWVCERPNILNVAITRSKENLYIVGDKNIWADKPFFKTAFEIINES